MAINFTVSYTFSPNTTIASAQVNTNFSDNAAVWQGLEAKTKSFAALQVDATPTATADVAIKSYVDKITNYRKPNLQYSSGTAVNLETGINGTSGQAQILFPDGTLRTDSTTGRINLNLSQVAALSGSAQSGLRTGALANNTWYAVYAVKVSDSTANFVTVADVVLPVQASFATLNSNFGTNSWEYLGMIRYGDQSATANAVLRFQQSGGITMFDNACTVNALTGIGIALATSASATTVTWTYAAGTSGAVTPTQIVMGFIMAQIIPGGTGTFTLSTGNSGNVWRVAEGSNTLTQLHSGSFLLCLPGSIQTTGPASTSHGIFLSGWVDPVLTGGANPIL